MCVYIYTYMYTYIDLYSIYHIKIPKPGMYVYMMSYQISHLFRYLLIHAYEYASHS